MLQRSQSIADQSSVASVNSYTSYSDEVQPASMSFATSPSIVAEDNRLWLNSSPVPRSSSKSKKVAMAADSSRRRDIRQTGAGTTQVAQKQTSGNVSSAYSHRVVTTIPTTTIQQFILHNGHKKVPASDHLSLKSSRSADGRPPRHPAGILSNSHRPVQRNRPPSAPTNISRQKATKTCAPPFK